MLQKLISTAYAARWVSIKNFLSGRRFRVRFGRHFSGSFAQENGALKGGVFGVALFALAINGIGNTLSLSIGKSLSVDDFNNFFVCHEPERPTRPEIAAGCNSFGEVELRERSPISNDDLLHLCRRRYEDPSLGGKLYKEVISTQSVVKFLEVLFGR